MNLKYQLPVMIISVLLQLFHPHIAKCTNDNLLSKKGIDIHLENKNDKTTQHKSNLVNTYIERGNVERSRRNYKLAISNFNQALKLNPDSISTYLHLAWTYKLMKDQILYSRNYDMAFRITPSSSGNYKDLGSFLLSIKKDHANALKYLNQAINIDGKNTIAYSERAIAYRMLDKHDLAIFDYKKILEIGVKPEDKSAIYESIAFEYILLKDYAKADIYYKQALHTAYDELSSERIVILKRLIGNNQDKIIDLDDSHKNRDVALILFILLAAIFLNIFRRILLGQTHRFNKGKPS
jgi:tetratricopeptide (TPR) repeat protein